VWQGIYNSTANSTTAPPLILWQTSMHANSTPDATQQSNAKFLPENTVIRWLDDLMMAHMVRDMGNELVGLGLNNICDDWFNLRPGAYRADLWRALVLWKYGGL
jgi:mannosyltransferase OCH1-like enzyme